MVMRPIEPLDEAPIMSGTSLVAVRDPNASTPVKIESNADLPESPSVNLSEYAKILENMTKLYPYDFSALTALGQLDSTLPFALALQNLTKRTLENDPAIRKHLEPVLDGNSSETEYKPTINSHEEVLDLSNQGLKSLYSNYRRVKICQLKPKIIEDVWVENEKELSWTDSKVAAFNPAQKLFMCVECECVGFLSRVAEHWLGAHANLRVFNCPRCPYTSAWSRCVKMHLTRQHNEQSADTTLWKTNSSLLEVTKMMHDLRTNVETKLDVNNGLADKRFYCPHCPYATDRRDLYTRHENIHKDTKPFHCYVCTKQFNRADHVKKHFIRMHPEAKYDIAKIRKVPPAKPNHNNPTTLGVNRSMSYPNNLLINEAELKLTTENGSSEVSPKVEDSNSIPNEDTTKEKNCEIQSLEKSPNSSSTTESLKGPTDDTNKKRRGAIRSYTCPYCQWSGTDNWCLKRHMNTHIKPFACVMCDYKAARAERLSTHVLKVHNKRICNKCNFLADTQERLLEHTREEHHNNPYSRRHICGSCNMSFDTRANLETHIHLSHIRPISPVDVDVVKITPIENVSNTLTSAHENLLENFSSEKSSVLKDDPDSDSVAILKSHTSEKISLLGDRDSSKIPILCTEKSLILGEEILQLVCPIEDCSMPFISSGALANHVRQTHDGIFSSRCPHCSYSLTNDELTKDHWLTHHEEVCNACVHVFTSVYGPQLWKKVNTKAGVSKSPINNSRSPISYPKSPVNISKSPVSFPKSPVSNFKSPTNNLLSSVNYSNSQINSAKSPLNFIVSGLNKRKLGNEPTNGFHESAFEKLLYSDSSLSPPSSPSFENDQIDRPSKRQRKQSCPKKVVQSIDEICFDETVAVDLESSQIDPQKPKIDSESSKILSSFDQNDSMLYKINLNSSNLYASSNQINLQSNEIDSEICQTDSESYQDNDYDCVYEKEKLIPKLKLRKVWKCLLCDHKPKFRTYDKLQIHKRIKHKESKNYNLSRNKNIDILPFLSNQQ